jgi:predicted phage replisome organizer
MSEKKGYYWLKLQTKFFESFEIKTILKYEKGATYVLFWQRLLLEVIDKIDSGIIRYKEQVPYTADVLSTITDTDIDTVKGALNIFVKLHMIEISEHGDLIIDEVIHEMVGRISDEGIRKREYRQKIQKIKKIGTMSRDVPKCPYNIEKEKEKEVIANQYFNIYQSDYECYLKSYPSVDIESECNKMVSWLRSNPKKQKSNYKRFVNNWLSRKEEENKTKNKSKIGNTLAYEIDGVFGNKEWYDAKIREKELLNA